MKPILSAFLLFCVLACVPASAEAVQIERPIRVVPLAARFLYRAQPVRRLARGVAQVRPIRKVAKAVNFIRPRIFCRRCG